MIRQLLVLDKTGVIAKHIDKIFSGFIRGYQVFHAASPEEAVALAKKQMIDLIAINGDDFAKFFSADTMRMLKEKIFPPPKLLLLLEPNLIDTLPGLEGKADYVLNSSNFRSLRLRRIINDLVHKKYMEEYQRESQEISDKKQKSQMIDQEFDAICEDLDAKYKNGSQDKIKEGE